MKAFLRLLLAALLPLASFGQVVPAANLQVELNTRNIKATDGSNGFILPSPWVQTIGPGASVHVLSGGSLIADPGAILTGIGGGGGGSPGGTNGEIQFNNAGAFGGTTLTWNGTTISGVPNPTSSSQISNKGYVDTQVALVTSVPGGSNSQLQFNSSGTFGGTAITYNGVTLSNVPNPVNVSDIANKAYVDTFSAGLVVRTAVALATTANIALTGEQTIDGVATSASRVLVKNQSTPAQNGVYVSAAGAWTRATDANTAGTLLVGFYYFVSNGTTLGSSGWTISTAPSTLGTDPVLFSQFSAGTSYTAGANMQLSSGVFSVNPNPSFASVTASGAGTFGSVSSAGAGSFGSVASGPISGTTFTSTSNANIRTSKVNFHTTVNVRDYGATGNGSTDDLAAINAAVGALTSYSVLYFPAGRYKITAGITPFAGLSNLLITGEGAEIFNSVGGTGANTIEIQNSCSGVEISGLRFVGAATTRGNGIHIRMGASNSYIHGCAFGGCSDFAVLISGEAAGYINNSIVSDNLFQSTKGDGVHVGSATNVIVSNNVFLATGDDSIGVVGDYPGLEPSRVVVSGNQMFSSGSASGAGIRVAEATDVLVEGNNIYSSVESGIRITRRIPSNTFYNTRISVVGNKLYNCGTNGGQLGAIYVSFCSQANILNNQVVDPVAGGGIALLDVNDTTVKNNLLRGIPFRGILCDDSTTTNVSTSWTQLFITDNDLDWIKGGEAIYIIPPSTVTITNLIISGNNAHIVGGNWIFYNRITNGRVWNNTTTSAATVSSGGVVSNVTFGNNN